MGGQTSVAWVVMPVVNGLDMTMRAIQDCLEQTGVDPRVLVVLQGSDPALREPLENWAQREPRLLVWSHEPPLPSLSSTWNRALEFVWAVGGDEALVVNNDVRLHAETYNTLLGTLHDLDALFVTAVGVRESQFDAYADHGDLDIEQHGGPDFSCFLISRACHAQYPFDEGFIPAYCEDLDYHRRLMLAGDGARIFSVNLPYLHYASQTVALMTPEERAGFAARSRASRQHYKAKWGGDVNEETLVVPFGALNSADLGYSVTTPELQRRVQAGELALPQPVAVPAPEPLTTALPEPFRLHFGVAQEG